MKLIVFRTLRKMFTKPDDNNIMSGALWKPHNLIWFLGNGRGFILRSFGTGYLNLLLLESDQVCYHYPATVLPDIKVKQ